MPTNRIDPQAVQWDDQAPLEVFIPGGRRDSQIDVSKVQWDDGPSDPSGAQTSDFARLISGQPSQEQQYQQVNAQQVADQSGLDNFFAGMGKSFVDSGRGLAQAGMALADQVPGVDLTDWRAGLQGKIDESRRLDAALMDSGSGLAGNITGYGVQVLAPGGALRGTAAGAAALPTTIAGNAAQGAVLGALQPVASNESRVENAALGGVGGAAGAAGAKVLGAGYRAARNALSGTSLLERQAGQQIIDAATGELTYAPSTVPGVQRTLAQSTADEGVSGLERVSRGQMANAPNNPYGMLDAANNRARVDALNRIAGTESDIAAAEAARNAQTSGLRNQAMREGSQADMAAQSAGMPGIAGNIASLRQQFSQQASEQGGRPAVQRAISDVTQALENAPPTVEGMYQVRKTIGDLMSGKAGSDKSYAQAATRELMDIRNALDNEIAQVAPSFSDYLDAYRTASQPINRMRVGNELLDGSIAVTDPLGYPVLSPAGFERRVGREGTDALDYTVQRATKFNKAKASDILSQDDISTIRGIQDDLRRIAAVERSSSKGSQTAPLLQGASSLARKSVLSAIPMVNNVSELVGRSLDTARKEKLAYLLANPARAREVISTLQGADKSAVVNTLSLLSMASGRAGPQSLQEAPPLEIKIPSRVQNPFQSSEINKF